MVLPISVVVRPISELKVNEWGSVEVMVNNYGEETLKSLRLEIFGDFEMEKPIEIEKIGQDELLSFQVRLRTLNPEGVGVIRVTTLGEEKAFTTTLRLPCAQPRKSEKKNFKRFTAYKEEICKVCQEKIYPGFLVVQCNCNALFHHKCVQDLKSCPICGRPWR